MERIHRELQIFFFKVKAEKFQKFAKNSNFQILKKTSHVTNPQIIVIICAKYRKTPSRTVDATERTRFSKSRSNDLEDIGQGQRSSHATHPLMLLIICTKYGKNPSRSADFFFQGQGRKISKICQKFKFPDSEKNVTRDTPSNDSDHLCQI